jgi:hypothetical protein
MARTENSGTRLSRRYAPAGLGTRRLRDGGRGRHERRHRRLGRQGGALAKDPAGEALQEEGEDVARPLVLEMQPALRSLSLKSCTAGGSPCDSTSES